MTKQQTGWLSPSGDFLPCKHYEHVSKAEEICEIFLYQIDDSQPDDALLKLGWAKLGISMLGNKQFYIRWERRLTPQQRYELKDLIEDSKPNLPLDSLTLSLWLYDDDIFTE